MAKRKIIVVVGPTGAGKSDIAWQIAKDYQGFLISADSRQIYKELDIITAKDKGEWQNNVYMVNGVEEYMVDFLEVSKKYSVADYQKDVYELLDKKDGLAILVGGTGLYVNAVVDNYKFPKEADKDLRKKLEKDLTDKGLEFLQKQLLKLDPQVDIDMQNPRRVLRALTYVLDTGKLWSEFSQKTQESLFEPLMIGIAWPRQELYNRINKRVDKMVELGAIEEARRVYEKYGEDWPAAQSLGYKDFIAYFKGEISKEKAIAKMKQRSRNYAKRQLTWFKRDKRIKWFKKSELSEIKKVVKDFIN